MRSTAWDIFISHATEDKEAVAPEVVAFAVELRRGDPVISEWLRA